MPVKSTIPDWVLFERIFDIHLRTHADPFLSEAGIRQSPLQVSVVSQLARLY